MNYRHAYHAGSFADVLKHAVLALVIGYMTRKDAAFRVIDTHAGTGRYDLAGVEAAKTGEWRDGIGRLLGPTAEPIPEAPARLLAPYLDIVRGENPAGRLEHYPGSPLIARRLLRPQDRLLLSELQPDDCAELVRRFARDAHTKVVELDGWLALKAFLPPKERRGVVLVDPPYEARDELARMVEGLAAAVRRFRTGTFLLWYPIKDPAAVRDFHRRLAGLDLPKVLSAELLLQAPADVARLNGCGLILVNPPWTLEADLAVLLPFLAQRLARAPGASHRLEWLAR